MQRKSILITARLLVVTGLLAATIAFSGCKPTAHGVTLNWHVPAMVGDKPIQGYNIYRSVNSGGPYTLIASRVQDATYRDSLVTSQRTYYYVVTTVDQAGNESRYSDEVSATVP